MVSVGESKHENVWFSDQRQWHLTHIVSLISNGTPKGHHLAVFFPETHDGDVKLGTHGDKLGSSVFPIIQWVVVHIVPHAVTVPQSFPILLRRVAIVQAPLCISSELVWVVIQNKSTDRFIPKRHPAKGGKPADARLGVELGDPCSVSAIHRDPKFLRRYNGAVVKSAQFVIDAVFVVYKPVSGQEVEETVMSLPQSKETRGKIATLYAPPGILVHTLDIHTAL